MQLILIIYCVLLFCLEFSASIPNGVEPQKHSGIYNIGPPYRAWNQRFIQPPSTQYQIPLQNNHGSYYPSDVKRYVPSSIRNIPQQPILNGYLNQQRIPNYMANNFPMLPDQFDKKNVVRNYVEQSVLTPKAAERSLTLSKQQPILSSQYNRLIAGNPAALTQTVPVPTSGSTQNTQTVVNISEAVNKPPPNVLDNSSLLNKVKPVVNKTTIGTKVMNSFFPTIPSRPSVSKIPNSQLKSHNVMIMPSIELNRDYKTPGVPPPPVSFEDRYFASASNPVETIVKKFAPPNYNLKQFASNPNIRNILATTKHKKRYLVIHPNGTIEHVDKLETVAQSNPNYVLIRAGDIISNSTPQLQKVTEVNVAAKVAPDNIRNNKAQNNSILAPIINILKVPTAKPMPSTLHAVNNIKNPVLTSKSTSTSNDVIKLPITVNNTNKLVKPNPLLPSKPTTTSKEAIKFPITVNNTNKSIKPNPVFPSKPTTTSKEVIKLPTTVTNVTSTPLTLTAPKSPPLRNDTVPAEVVSNIKIPFSQTSKNNTLPALSNKTSENSHHPNLTKIDYKEIEPLINLETSIVKDNDENEEPTNKPTIIYGANVTKDNESIDTPSINAVKQETGPKPTNKVVVEPKSETPSINNTSVEEDVATAVILPNKDSTPIEINKPENTAVNPKPLESKAIPSESEFATLPVPVPVKAEAAGTNVTHASKSAPETPKQPSTSAATATNVSVKEEQKPEIPTPNEYPKNSNESLPKSEDVQDDSSDVSNEKPDVEPEIWFKTTDSDFWDKIRGKDNHDVVYFFQIHNQPKVEYNTTRTIHPNGTIVEETIKSLWEIEGDPPIVTKTMKIINPEDEIL